MKLLITAGGSTTPIDRLRVMSAIARGRSITKLVSTAWQRGHELVVVTSTSEVLADVPTEGSEAQRVVVVGYQTQDDLLELLPQCIHSQRPDAIIHAASLSEYVAAGVYVPEVGTLFNTRARQWEATAGTPKLNDVKTNRSRVIDPEQWLRLVRAPRVIERAKSQWGFKGVLVLFRTEQEMTDLQLVESAEHARAEAAADVCLIGTVDGETTGSFLGPISGKYERITRRELAERVLAVVEDLHRTRIG